MRVITTTKTLQNAIRSESLTHLERRLDLISKGFPPDALPALSGAGGVAGLDHEVCDVAVELAACVRARCAVGEEVLGGAGCGFAEYFDLG